MDSSVIVKLGKRRMAVSKLGDIDMTNMINNFERNYVNIAKLAEWRFKCHIKISTYSLNRKDEQNQDLERLVVERLIMMDNEIFGPNGKIGWSRMTNFFIKVIATLLNGWHNSMEDRMCVQTLLSNDPNNELEGQIHIKINLTDLEILDEKIR